ncbi:MAG: AraC family transcriptional regulator [Myxococcales bacterium FL481]|nr:MAG: AraC family transcriptional regulator [Myxococcales bacterium FL481]
MDVLADVLTVTQLASAVLGCSKLISPWALEVSPDFHASVHVIIRGTLWLQIEDRDPIHVSTGDVLLIGAGVRHCLLEDRAYKPLPYRQVLDEMERRLTDVGEGPADIAAEILCAKYRFEHRERHPLVSRLPSFIHLRATDVALNPQLQLLSQLLHIEASQGGAGSDLVVPRLVDSLLVFIIRTWIELRPEGSIQSWFSALRDPGIRRALQLIHESPDAPWTVESLAQGASQSRASFARKFAALVGETPAAYLTRWRMCLAARALRDGQKSVEAIAGEVGYDSAAAFSKAFKRHYDQPPGKFRTAS